MSPNDNKREVHIAADFLDTIKKLRTHERGEDAKTRQIERGEDARFELRQWLLTLITTCLLFITAGFTLWQSYSSKISANAARDAADSARKALDQNARSWLEPEIINEPDHNTDMLKRFADDGNVIRVDYQLTNIGKFPITEMAVRAKVEVLYARQAPHLNFGEGRNRGFWQKILYPGRNVKESVSWFGAPENNSHNEAAVTPELVQDFRAGKRYIVIYGEGIYSDPLGPHWYRFCYVAAPFDTSIVEKSFPTASCSAYDSAGDGAPPS